MKKVVFIVFSVITAITVIGITISKSSAWPLDSRIEFWEYASFVGALVVILGIAIECFELGEKWIEKWGKEQPHIKARLFHSECLKSLFSFGKKWETEIETLGFSIVISGLVIELGGSITAFRLSNQRDSITKQQVAEAWKVASEAKEQTANIETTNALLWKTNMDIRSNLATLELKVKPRAITLKQRKDFLIWADYMNKMPVKVIVGIADNETMEFAQDVRAMLDEAGFGSQDMGIITDPTFVITRKLGDLEESDPIGYIKNEPQFVFAIGPIPHPDNAIPNTNSVVTVYRIGQIFDAVGIKGSWFPGDYPKYLKLGEAAVFVPEKSY